MSTFVTTSPGYTRSAASVSALQRHRSTGRALLRTGGEERIWGADHDENETLHAELLARALEGGDEAAAGRQHGLPRLREALERTSHLDVYTKDVLCAAGAPPRLTLDHPAAEATHEVLRRGTPDCACNESYYSRVVDDETLPAIVRAIAWRLRERTSSWPPARKRATGRAASSSPPAATGRTTATTAVRRCSGAVR